MKKKYFIPSLMFVITLTVFTIQLFHYSILPVPILISVFLLGFFGAFVLVSMVGESLAKKHISTIEKLEKDLEESIQS